MAIPYYAERDLLFERKNSARILTLNRPRHLNTVHTGLLSRLVRLVKTVEYSKEINLAILKGNGRAFCVGGDLKHLMNAFINSPTPEEGARALGLYSQMYELHHLLGTMKKPVVTIMNGLTCGVGSGLSAFSHFRIATEKTLLAMPETSSGTFCDMGSSFFMSRLDYHVGTYLALTARFLKAEDVYMCGFATHFVHSSQLPALEARLTELEENDLDYVNRVIEEFAVDEFHQPSHFTLDGERLENINRWFQYDTVEEIIEALQNDGSEFAVKTAEKILTNSPLCLKLTLENYRIGRHMSLVECLRMETRIWHVAPFIKDFRIGVESKLMTKSKPIWSPNKLQDVDLELDIRANIIHAYGPTRYRENNPIDFFERPVNFCLPTEKEILEAQGVHQLSTPEKAIQWFTEFGNGKRFGLAEKIHHVYRRQRR
ncbi:ClpP/crotonase-like domain-containing protein [Sporodiniella umbellata]|nr:ClpP/crotonase-like domain-containing protein [Sporodiniella umbellata]